MKTSEYELPKTEEELLVKMPATMRPFQSDKPLYLPMYNFVQGTYSGKVAGKFTFFQ